MFRKGSVSAAASVVNVVVPAAALAFAFAFGLTGFGARRSADILAGRRADLVEHRLTVIAPAP